MYSTRPREGERAARAPEPQVQVRILIVEDCEDLREMMALRLRRRGFAASTAEDVASAVAEIEKGAPDVILLDIGLPGADGYVLLDHLRAKDLGVPVIVMTGYSPLVHEPKSRAAGALALMQKPLDFGCLLAVIGEAVAARARAVA